MAETTLTLSNGKKVSLETIEIALEAYFEKHPEEFIFQAGDVCDTATKGEVRIIISNNGNVESYNADGKLCSTSQKQFEASGYRKIGVLSEYIK